MSLTRRHTERLPRSPNLYPRGLKWHLPGLFGRLGSGSGWRVSTLGLIVEVLQQTVRLLVVRRLRETALLIERSTSSRRMRSCGWLSHRAL